MPRKPADPSPPAGHNHQAADRLRSYAERAEHLLEEMAALREDMKDLKLEVKAAGFDVKTFNTMLKDRQLSQEELQEKIALEEIYRSALGMLDDTPLGAAALKRLSKPEPPPPPPPGEAPPEAEPTPGSKSPGAPPPEPPPPAAPTPEEITAARLAGADAQVRGEKVTSNPHPFADPRRAAWDAGWCTSAGSDGMDIPAAWKRTSTKKDAKK
jgi:uncharacterized protein (UPF0335 family)